MEITENLYVRGDIRPLGSVIVKNNGHFGLRTHDGSAHVIPDDPAGNMHLKNVIGRFFVDARQHIFRSPIGVMWFHIENGYIWTQRGHHTSKCDYAEYFESKDGKEIEVGTSVILDGEKIRPVKKNEVPIGIISASPGIVGGVHIEWPKKYLRDEFGNQIMEEYKEEIMKPKKEKVKKERQKIEKKTFEEKVTKTGIAFEDGKYFQKEMTETITRELEEPVFKEVDLYDAEKKKIIGKHRIPVMETYEEEIDFLDEKGQPVMVGTGKFETKTRPKINPEYDETKEYIPREKRAEWNCVGLLGQLPLRKGQPVAPTWIKIKDISKDVELWLVK